MGQIVRRKKRRPAQVDPVGRGTPQSEREPRRSNRRRSVKYMFELDDYFDELGLFEDDEDQQKREKELKQLLKVESKGTGGGQPESAGPKQGRPGRRMHHPASPSSSFSSDVDLLSKKRKMNEGIDDENGDASYEEDCSVEARERKSELKAKILAPGPQTRSAPLGLPLPDKKTLELILNIIQRKDVYGVFAEPVDPEELPDYHGVIKNPMDFGTVRNKLSNGLYTTSEQIESDVYLICSNAMQYNAPDTIYYKQAHGMHELAKRKFYELSLNSRSSEKEKYEQNIRSSSILNRQVKSPVSRTVQDPVGFDFSYGATLEVAVDIHHVSNALLADGSSTPCNVDRLVERNSFLNDNNFDKGKALLPGNSSLSKPGRKLLAHEENRRATYDISFTHPSASSESLFSTFEGESKQLVPVGAYAEHSYARSLARFAAALGPVAWKISSKRIEQALPQEVKYGRGWVGEYEPLSTPVLMLENCTVMEPPYFSKKLRDDPRKFEKKIPSVSISSKEIQGTMLLLEKNLHSVGPAKIKPASAPATFPMKAQPDRENVSEAKASFFLASCSKPSSSSNLSCYHEKSGSKNAGESEKQGLKQVELNGPPIFNKNVVDFIGQEYISKGSEVEVSRSIFTSRNVNFLTSSGSAKQPDIKEVSVGGLPNGKVVGDRINSNTVACSSSNLAKQVGYYPREQGQGLSDPVCMMRMLAGKDQNQQKSVYQSSTDAHRVLSPDLNRDNLNNTITAVSHALRSVGAGGFRPIGENTNLFKNQHANFLNIYARDMHSQGSRFREESPASVIHSRPDRNNSPLNVFVSQGCPQPMRVGTNMHFQNQHMTFPPFPPNSKQMLDSLPPDLNVGFHSPGSPGKTPSSGGLIESQQPDLALQL